MTPAVRQLLLERAAWLGDLRGQNLLSAPLALDNAAWTKTNVTISADNGVAPDGTTTADLVTPATGSNAKSIFQQFTYALGRPYEIASYVKPIGGRWCALCFGSAGTIDGAFYDVQNGVLGTAIAGFAPTIKPIGAGWWRIGLTTTLPSGNKFLQFEPHSADNQAQTWNSAAGAETFQVWLTIAHPAF